MTSRTPAAAGAPTPVAVVQDAVQALLAERFGPPVRQWHGDNRGPSQPAALRLIPEQEVA